MNTLKAKWIAMVALLAWLAASGMAGAQTDSLLSYGPDSEKDFNILLKSAGEILKNPVDPSGNLRRSGEFMGAALTLGLSEKKDIVAFQAATKTLIEFTAAKAGWYLPNPQGITEGLTKPLKQRVVLDFNDLTDPGGTLGSVAPALELDPEFTVARNLAAPRITEADWNAFNAAWNTVIQAYLRMTSHLRTNLIQDQLPGKWTWKWTRQPGQAAEFAFDLDDDGTWKADVTYYDAWPPSWAPYTVMKGTWAATADEAGKLTLTLNLTRVSKPFGWWSASHPSPLSLIDSATILGLQHTFLTLDNPNGPELTRTR